MTADLESSENAQDDSSPQEWRQSYSEAESRLADELFTEHYHELMAIARRKRRRSDANLTLNTTDILHESFLKLRQARGFAGDKHFVRSAVLAMRHVLCDYARRKLTSKRHAEGLVSLDEDGSTEVLPEYGETPEQLVAIAELMTALAEHNPRWSTVVDARYFSGMTEEETAALLDISLRTARRDWQGARRWIAQHLAS